YGTSEADRNSGDCQDLLEFFHKGNVICRLNQHQLQERLKAGKVLVMFDGLDEVFEPTQREKIITDIHRFTNEYPKVRVIVTSRIIGYKPQRLKDAEFRHFLLQDLEPEQVQDFIYRWHKLTFTDEADKERKRERLQRAIDTSKAIGELAGNPLLLTMMAILNRNQELPRDRPELYNQASRVLLHQWDVERKLLEDPRVDVVTIDYKDKQAMLRQIAYFMQAADKGLAGNLIRGEDLARILIGYLKSIEVSNPRNVARLLIEQLRGRNFILCFLGGDSYGFVHRTFLEYFCAWEYVWQFKETQNLSIEELKTEVFGKHWQDESWHEVLRLIAGMIDTRFTGKIIDYLISQDGEGEKFSNLFLAAEFLLEVRNLSGIATTANKLLEQLKGLTKYDLNYYYEQHEREARLVREIRTQAVAAVATTWQDAPKTLPLLKQWVHSGENEDVRSAAVEEIACGWKDEPETLPLLQQLAQSDDDGFVRRAAVEEIARGWKDKPETLPLLKQLAQSDDDWIVRSAAAREITRGWKDKPDTLPLLKQLAQSDDDKWVRSAAVREITRGWKDKPETLPLLKQLAQSDEDKWVKHAAVREIARGWKDEPETLPLLKQLAQSDEDKWVKHAAVREIARGWKDKPETLPLLKQLAQSDDGFVRSAAVEEIARGWKDEPDTLPLLKQLAQSDEHEDVRSAAAREITRGWKDEPDTLPLLQQLAQSDEHWNVRSAAVEEIARGWKDEPDTLPLLKQLAQSDDDGFVRSAAVKEITRGWKDEPDTLPLLKQLAQSDEHWNVRRAAVREIARGWKDEPDTLPLLKQLAQSDDGFVRSAAVEEIARGWKDEPDTLPLFQQLAQSDDDGFVRSAAVEEIARGWKDKLWMLEFLCDRAVNDPFERKKEKESNPRQLALKIIIKQYPNHSDTLPLLRDRAENDSDEQLREFARRKLAKLGE
ncbi:MAG: NTPase, partial [Symploca sp. SIO1B1]|nr:NTPase [Symploca sp. SIO1B1]